VSKFHEFEMSNIQGEQVAFATFEDQVSLIVNVASQ
jgi:glutathione peroxidase-family protein